jgi:hypothetical protein
MKRNKLEMGGGPAQARAGRHGKVKKTKPACNAGSEALGFLRRIRVREDVCIHPPATLPPPRCGVKTSPPVHHA